MDTQSCSLGAVDLWPPGMKVTVIYGLWQIDLRSNYERKSDGIGYLMKHAEIVGKRKHSPAVQVRQQHLLSWNDCSPHPGLSLSTL